MDGSWRETSSRDAWMDHVERGEGCMDGSWRGTRGMHGWFMGKDERDSWMRGDHGPRREGCMEGALGMDHAERREGCMDGSWRETRGMHGWIMERDEL